MSAFGNRICTWTILVGCVLYLAALAVLLIGTYGLFGQERDPLSGVFLLPLGLPWTLMLGHVGDVVAPWLAALAPLLNLSVLALICRRRKGRTT